MMQYYKFDKPSSPVTKVVRKSLRGHITYIQVLLQGIVLLPCSSLLPPPPPSLYFAHAMTNKTKGYNKKRAHTMYVHTAVTITSHG